jgi:hypothetical protein
MLARTLVILSVLVSAGAFVVSPHAVTRTRSAVVSVPSGGNVESVWNKSTSTTSAGNAAGPALLMAKKKGKAVVAEEKPATNVLTLISPFNPYMLFVYPILFIFAIDYFNLGPK